MAERRMFAKSITDSGKFLRLQPTVRLLYYDLGMHADDDGIVEAYSVITQTRANEDDLRVLVTKGFVRILNEDLVTLILDWRTNNNIRSDRYHPSIYKDLLLQLTDGIPDDNQVTTKCQPSDNQMDTEDRLGKDRLGKDRLDYNSIIDAYNSICKSFPSVKSLSEARKKAIKARLNVYTVDQIREAFTLVEESDFLKGANSRNWQATFDWIIKDTNIAKILDGNYANKAPRQSVVPQEDMNDLDDLF